MTKAKTTETIPERCHQGATQVFGLRCDKVSSFKGGRRQNASIVMNLHVNKAAGCVDHIYYSRHDTTTDLTPSGRGL